MDCKFWFMRAVCIPPPYQVVLPHVHACAAQALEASPVARIMIPRSSNGVTGDLLA